MVNKVDQMASEFGIMFGNNPTDKQEEQPEVQPKVRKERTSKKDSKKSASAKKELFSVYIDSRTKAVIKKYAGITGQPIGDIISAAVTDYIKSHKPTQEQRNRYEERRKEEDIEL